MKAIIVISFISIPVLLSSFYIKRDPGLLHGKWNFVRFYAGKDIDIKDKSKETKMWPDIDVYKTYDPDGSFVYFEEDMIDVGNYIFDKKNNTIKEFNRYNKDTEFLKLAYLDSNYLIYVNKYNYTFLYSKK